MAFAKEEIRETAILALTTTKVENRQLYIIFQSNEEFTLEVFEHQRHWEGTVEYSYDKIDWFIWDGIEIISSENGVLYLRGENNTRLNKDTSTSGAAPSIYLPGRWVITPSDTRDPPKQRVSCTGNIEAVIDYKELAKGNHPYVGRAAFINLFYGCKVLSTAPDLLSPSVYMNTYTSMFEGCTGLEKANIIAATTIANEACARMFYGCDHLEKAPAILALRGRDIIPITPQLEWGVVRAFNSMFEGCSRLKNPPPAIRLEHLGVSTCERMFYGCERLKEAPEMLTIISFSEASCKQMFQDCAALIRAPEINATTVREESCYMMFKGCTSLELPPSELPAMATATRSYYQMFMDCIALHQTPNLPARRIEDYSYYAMFENCTSLTQVPQVLPGGSVGDEYYLSDYAFRYMFANCSSLVIPSALPRQPSTGCYDHMFYGCISLRAIPALPAQRPPGAAYRSMFEGCSSLIINEEEPGYAVQFTEYPSGLGLEFDIAQNMFLNTGGDIGSRPQFGGHIYFAEYPPISI